MKTLTHEHFYQWMEIYGKASADNDPKTSSALFAQNAKYYENPFTEPMIGRESIYQYWIKGAQNLKDKESTFEILAINENIGIARWQSIFTVVESGKCFSLDCLFVVDFDDEGLCKSFREWWHIQENSFDNRHQKTFR